MEKIKSKIGSNYIWVSADETVDILGRCVVNVVIGILHPTQQYQPYVIECHISDRVNSEIMFSIIDECLNYIFDNNVDEKRTKVLLFLSDGAPYMIKTGKLLKEYLL
jgi:hypothetical protein